MNLARREFRRILLIKPSSLGDIVHALPVLHGLRWRYPDARIEWLVSTNCQELLVGDPRIDAFIPFDRRWYGQLARNPRALADFARFVHDLHARAFDLVIDLQGLFRSGFFAWASGADVRIGPTSAREFAWMFYTHRIPPGGANEHAVLRNYRVAGLLGFADVPMALRLHVQPAARVFVARLLAEAGVASDDRFAILAPGARWETKVWPADRMAAVADHLQREHGLKVVLIGGPGERAACEAVERSATSPLVNLCGRTSLPQLVAVLERAELLLSNDSGPMHIAVALDRPVVAVVGPTNERRTGPFSTRSRAVRESLPCAPCYLKKLAQCPYDHACMQGLAAERVQHAADDLLRHVERPDRVAV